MRFALALPALAAIAAHAQEIENEDVPGPCRDVCANTLSVSDRCNNDDDDTELQCICTSNNASSDIPNCEACVAQYDESDNNVRDIVESCSFTVASTFTSVGAAAATPASNTVVVTSMTMTSVPATQTSDEDGDDENTDDPSDNTDDDDGNDENTDDISDNTDNDDNDNDGNSQVTVTQAPTQTAGSAGSATSAASSNNEDDGDDEDTDDPSDNIGNAAMSLGVPAFILGGAAILGAALLL